MSVRQYLMGIVAAALICGIIRSLFPEKGTIGAVIKTLLGIVVLLAVVSPWVSVSTDDFYNWDIAFYDDARSVVEQAENSAGEQVRQRIIEQTQAYILAKADSLGAELEVDVEVTEETIGVPCAVTITGAVAPYAKPVISQMLADDLGIDREAQTWIS